jgi:hypothetical protein
MKLDFIDSSLPDLLSGQNLMKQNQASSRSMEGGNFDIKGRGCTREKKLFKLTIL